MVQRNGKILLLDVFSGSVVCCLALPSTHLLATHCSPVLAFNAKDHTLFIKGKSKQTPVLHTEKIKMSELQMTFVNVTNLYILHKQCLIIV